MTRNNSVPESGQVTRVPLKEAELPLALARVRLSPEFDEELEVAKIRLCAAIDRRSKHRTICKILEIARTNLRTLSGSPGGVDDPPAST